MNMKKVAAATAALSLTAAVAVGGTMAYLQDVTDPVVNTFTISDGISLSLTESTGTESGGKREHILVPGTAVSKDPKVQVTAADGDFYVFVKIEEGADVATYYTYEVDSAWIAVDGVQDVYYRTVSAKDSAGVSVLAGDHIDVLSTVSGIEEGDDLDLTFTAYAIQQDGFDGAATAWAAVKDALPNA